ncbi:MAG TPA: hypothetical protein VN739_00620, partial [Nitrososphaerales archaeon]|nr:hypothetical protein [Nitrososphaerales archaeon]
KELIGIRAIPDAQQLCWNLGRKYRGNNNLSGMIMKLRSVSGSPQLFYPGRIACAHARTARISKKD